jgi:hypothetical protein
VRGEQPQHSVERIRVQPGVGRDPNRRSAALAYGVGGAAVGDDVQAAARDVRFGEVGKELGRLSSGVGRRL